MSSGQVAQNVSTQPNNRKKSKIEAVSKPVFSWLNNNKLYNTTPIGGFGFISQSKFSWETTVAEGDLNNNV